MYSKVIIKINFKHFKRFINFINCLYFTSFVVINFDSIGLFVIFKDHLIKVIIFIFIIAIIFNFVNFINLKFSFTNLNHFINL